MAGEIVIFGGVTMYKLLCPICGEEFLSGEQNATCYECESPVTFDISEVTTTVVSEGRRGRKGLTEATKEEILHGQRHNCYWCGAKLGSWVIYRSKPTLLKVHFDHVLPHSHGGGSHPSNMVASCHICNLWKGNNVFDDEEDCQDFLIKKRAIFKANGNLKVL